MTPRIRAGIFVGAAFALMLPYLAFVVYFSRRLPQNNLPLWFTNTLAIWFVANFLVLVLLAKKIFRRQVSATQNSPQTSTKMWAGGWVFRIVVSYLVILWCAFFLYGVKGTIEGKYALNRAIPAGAFLLFFIVLFGWSLYRSSQKKT
jgi:hypothetical protein